MPITKFASNPALALELPAEGFPYSEPDLRDWFHRKYGREATELEIGAVMGAMATRDDKSGPDQSSVEPGGWRVEPVAAPDPQAGE